MKILLTKSNNKFIMRYYNYEKYILIKIFLYIRFELKK